MSDIERPPNGYALSLYDELVREVRELPTVIERCRVHIAEQQAYLLSCEHRLSVSVSTLAWMELNQADEIAAMQQRRAAVHELLREAGWFQDESPSEASGEATP